MLIHNLGTDIDVHPSDSSELVAGIMQASTLTLHFKHNEVLNLHQGATVEFQGETFTLIYPEQIKKLFKGYYEYTITFHSTTERLKQKLLKDPSNVARTSFVFAGTPTDFARLIARSMGDGWTVGQCLKTSYDKTVAFRQDTCWTALGRIAQEFQTEWVVEGKTLSFRKHERYKENPLPMSYGMGNGFRSGVSRRGNNDKLPINRLYVLGGSRNIDPTSYGEATLHLPKDWQEEAQMDRLYQFLRTDSEGKYISVLDLSGVGAEGSVELTDIYPSRVGTVSKVLEVDREKHFYDIVDESIPANLNYNDYRIPGEKAILKFQTGDLAGREFELKQTEKALTGYHHLERRFELVPKEQDGFIMPSPEWSPHIGDKYAIFGIALPQEYVERAERELLEEAIRTLDERRRPQYTFEGVVDPIWASKRWLEIGGKFVPGGHILFSDPEFHPTGTVIRITSITQKVNNPKAPTMTLSTAPVSGSFLSRVDKSEAEEVLNRRRNEELQRNQKQSYRQALEHIAMVEKAVNDVEGFTQRIKPSIIETMGILVGSQATQFDFVQAVGSLKSAPFFVNYNPSTQRVRISRGVVCHKTYKIEGITNHRKPTDYHYWTIPEYISPALTEDAVSYYIYIRVREDSKEGVYLLSKDPLPFISEDSIHLLVGTLSSVIEGDRAYNRLYGFASISPGQMTVDSIASANGNMLIDLAQGKITASSVSFRRPDGNTTDVGSAVDEANEKANEAYDLANKPEWAIEIIDKERPYAPPLLSDKRPQATYTYQAYRNGKPIDVPSSLISWHRRNPYEYDDEGVSDTAWENAHRHDKEIVLTKRQILGEATFTITADPEELEAHYLSKQGK